MDCNIHGGLDSRRLLNVYFFTKSLKDISLSIAYPVFSGACILLMIASFESDLWKRN